MPDIDKVIRGLSIERECVSRDCDRNCAICDLVQEREWLLSVYDDALKLLEKRIPKEPIHIHHEYTEHDWVKDENGKPDDCAFDYGNHNGPVCKRCLYSFCIFCKPNGWNDEPCVVDYYVCPSCGKQVNEKQVFCEKCGQLMDWNNVIKGGENHD